MHSVHRSPAPSFLIALLANGVVSYSQLNFNQRRQIRDALSGDFGGICAYCEKQCDESWRENGAPEENRPENEHFLPDEKFPESSLEWLNLVYSCKRCNDVKGNFWPTRNIGSSRYDGFVNPNAVGQQPGNCEQRLPAESFFDFATYASKGLINPEQNAINPLESAMAYATIEYLDLNSDHENPDRRGTGLLLPEQRQDRAAALKNRFLAAWADGDIKRIADKLNSAIQTDQPFSSYIKAYIKHILDAEYPGVINLVENL